MSFIVTDVPLFGAVLFCRCTQYVSPTEARSWSTSVWLAPSVLATARSKSSPTANTQELAPVVVSAAVGAPDAAPVEAVAPLTLVLAPVNDTTVIAPTYEPFERAAVTVTLLSAAGATACQISAVPGRLLERDRSVQVSPPPVTEPIVCEPRPGPSVAMNASSSSFPCLVLKLGDTIVEAAALRCLLTWTSIASGAWARVVNVLSGELAVLPDPSVLVTLKW